MDTMTRLTQEELNEVIRKHGLWLEGNPKGKKADLSYKDLSGLDFSNTNLKYADLHDANLKWADLHGADLRGANLNGTDIDRSSFSLWCGGFDFKADKRIASQIAYHFCRLNCDDEEFIKARNYLLKLANQFHRVNSGECDKLKKIKLPAKK